MDRCPECGCEALASTDFTSPSFVFPLPGLECPDCGRVYLDEQTIDGRLQTLVERCTTPTMRVSPALSVR